ncbi:MAG: glycosyltransferase family 39 protein [Lewinellaceae bacterium]|nr:glycosyltransferase family 39 protein [Lewinellaceae bacterium]
MNVLRYSRNPWVWLAAGLLAILVRGLLLDVMDVDASQYASISMEMMQNGSWLQVKHRYGDYLDKPPLLFWSSALSFMLFGLSNWAYKLPSVLAALAGVYAVYRFSLLFYTEKTARQAAFLLASSTGFILICNDVRTDTLLLGTTCVAIWQLAEYLQHGRWKNLIGAFLTIGFAMLAKGPIGLVLPALAAGSHLLLQRDFRSIFRWQWLAGLGITALVLLPMCWGLYNQFDLHPEKPLNDRISTSGLYFFFWEQSFGRITGNNIWRNDAGPFYFFHVYLWAFLPWALLLPAALWFHGRKALGKIFYFRKTLMPEAFSLGGFLLTFIALSASKYKLPHYIFVTLPWAAVLLAAWLNAEGDKKKAEDAPSMVPAGWVMLGYLVFLIALATAFLLLGFVFPGNLPAWVVMIAGTAFLLLRIVQNPLKIDSDVFVQRGIMVALLTGFTVNYHFYPRLLPYQSTATIGRYLHEQGIPKDKIVFFRRHGHALDFYSQTISQRMDSAEQVRQTARNLGEVWVYTNQRGKNELNTAGVRYETVYEMGHFQAALLNARFLNPATRVGSLEPVWLLKVEGL